MPYRSFFNARTVGSTLYYATHFLPAPKKETARNILDLCALIESAGNIYDTDTRTTKLQWWKNEIRKSFEKSATHPVTKQLQEDIWLYNLPEDYLTEIVDGHLQHGELNASMDNAERDLYLQRTGGLPALLLAEIGGYKDHNTPKVVQILGSQLRYTWLLRMLRQQHESGRWILTKDELADAGATPSHLGQPTTSPELSQLINNQTSDTHKQMTASLSYIPPRDYAAITPVLITANVEFALYRELQKDNFKILERQLDLTAIRKLWIAWRARSKALKGRLLI